MSKEDTTSDGRMWAALSYGSSFIGLPLGIIPIAQRNDAFALHHARHAVAAQLAFIVSYFAVFALAFLLFFCTFGLSHIVMIPLLMMMILWPMGMAVHGIILSLNGDWELPYGTFGLGDKLFAGMEIEEAEEGAGAEGGGDGAEAEAAADGDGEKPAADGDGEKPAADGDGEKPTADGDGEKPAADGDGEKPAADGDGEKPAGG